MFRLPSEKEEHKDTIGALILSIFIIIVFFMRLFTTVNGCMKRSNIRGILKLTAFMLRIYHAADSCDNNEDT